MGKQEKPRATPTISCSEDGAVALEWTGGGLGVMVVISAADGAAGCCLRLPGTPSYSETIREFPVKDGIPQDAQDMIQLIANGGSKLDPRFHLEAERAEAGPPLPMGAYDTMEAAALAVEEWEKRGVWPEGYDAVLTCPAAMERWMLVGPGAWEVIPGG